MKRVFPLICVLFNQQHKAFQSVNTQFINFKINFKFEILYCAPFKTDTGNDDAKVVKKKHTRVKEIRKTDKHALNKVLQRYINTERDQKNTRRNVSF